MWTVLLPPGGYPITVNKYIISNRPMYRPCMLLSTYALTEGHSILPGSIKIVCFICYTSLLISWICKKTSNVRKTQHRGAFAQPLLPCKRIRITYSGCVFVDLVVQHAKCMRRIILLSVGCPAVPYPSTLSHKCTDSLKYVYMCILNIKCVFWFCLQLL
jgi:hypothetical protein